MIQPSFELYLFPSPYYVGGTGRLVAPESGMGRLCLVDGLKGIRWVPIDGFLAWVAENNIETKHDARNERVLLYPDGAQQTLIMLRWF